MDWKDEHRALTQRSKLVRSHPGRHKPGSLLKFSRDTYRVSSTGNLIKLQPTPK